MVHFMVVMIDVFVNDQAQVVFTENRRSAEALLFDRADSDR